MKCESSLTLTAKPSASFSPCTMPMLRVTPPVKVTSGSMPTRRISPSERETIERWTPSRMSSTFLPRPSHARISDSAKTVQVVSDLHRRSPRSVSGPSSPSGISSAGGDGAEEASGAGGALVVHAEVEDLAGRVDADRLRVLPAHVEHGARAREHVDGAARVAADLGHLRVAEGHPVAAVAGADHEADLPLLDARSVSAAT